jgi:hypothetical protein
MSKSIVSAEQVINRFISEEGVKFDQERDDWMLDAMAEYASQFKESQPTEVAGLRSGDWYLNERGNKITVLSVADSWCMVREGDKKPFVVPEEFVLGTFDNSITQ